MWRHVRDEIIKIMFQKKSYVVIGGHLLLLLLCFIGFKTTNLHSFQEDVTRHSSLVVKNIFEYIDGLFFARAALVPTYFILFPIFICSLAGDMVAGEIQEGTLKLYASRDRSRAGIIIAKFIALFIISVFYAFYFAAVNLVIGRIFFGPFGLQLVFLHEMGIDTDLVLMSPLRALEAYFLSVCYFSVSIMGLGSVTLFLSTIFNRMTSATVAGITIYFVCYIVSALPFSAEIRPYLLSSAMNNIFIFWMERMPEGRLLDNCFLLGIYITVFASMSLIWFNAKDIK